jgi:hypothetical protein
VYARRTQGQELTLGGAGSLFNGSMVLYDLETRTFWTQGDGKAVEGPLTGRRLQPIPSVLTDWQTWLSLHPSGTVALRAYNKREMTRELYKFCGLGCFVLGVSEGDQAKAWSFEDLTKCGAIQDEWLGTPVLVVLDQASWTGRLYERPRPTKDPLAFELVKGRLVDKQTGSVWQPLTGRAESGPLAGQCLKPLAAGVSYRSAWFRLHPDSD